MSAVTARPLSARLRKFGLTAALLLGGTALIAIVCSALIRELGGSPFRMVIEPDGDHAIVQFTQPGSKLVSKSFPIDIRFEKPEEIVLDSPTAKIPKGNIEFADTTLLPGRFKIRLGEILFDVMLRGIEVNAEQSDWLPDNPQASK